MSPSVSFLHDAAEGRMCTAGLIAFVLRQALLSARARVPRLSGEPREWKKVPSGRQLNIASSSASSVKRAQEGPSRERDAAVSMHPPACRGTGGRSRGSGRRGENCAPPCRHRGSRSRLGLQAHACLRTHEPGRVDREREACPGPYASPPLLVTRTSAAYPEFQVGGSDPLPRPYEVNAPVLARGLTPARPRRHCGTLHATRDVWPRQRLHEVCHGPTRPVRLPQSN